MLIIINASVAAAQLEITFWSRFRSCLAYQPYSPLSPALTTSTSPSIYFSPSFPCRLSPFLPPLSPSGAFCVLKCLQHGQSQEAEGKAGWLLRRRGKIKSDSNVRLARDKQKGGKKPKGTTSKRNETNRESSQRESERSEKFKLPFGCWKTSAQV